MKRMLALLLALVMIAAMLVACNDDTDGETPDDGGTTCTTHTDTNLDGKCDTCGTAVTIEITNAAGAAMTAAVKAQLKAAKSMKVEFVVVTEQTETEANDTDYDGSRSVFTVYLSRTENGVNAKVDIKSESRNTADAAYETVQEGTVLYLVDNVLYVRDDAADDFTVTDLNPLFNPAEPDTEGMTDVSSMLAQMLQGLMDQLGEVEITEDQLAELGTAILKTLNVSNNRGELVLDAKPALDSFKAYVTGLELNTKTLEQLLDDALALIDEELTVASILSAIGTAGSMTVGEAILAIDEFLAENAETSLQAIYDKIVANEQIKAMAQQLLGINESNWENDVKGFKFAEVSDEIKSLTVYDFVMQMIELFMPHSETAPDPELQPTPYTEEGDEPTFPTLEELIATVDAVLDMTLADLEQQVLGMPLFTQLKQIVGAITVNELNAKLGVQFKGLFLIDTITLDAAFDIAVDNGDESVRTTFSLAAKIFEISTETITITAPTNVADAL